MNADVADSQLPAPSARRVTRLTAIRALLGGTVLALTVGAPELNDVSASNRKAHKRHQAHKRQKARRHHNARKRHRAPARRKRHQTNQSAATQPAVVSPPDSEPRPDPIIIEDPCEAFPGVCDSPVAD